MDIDIYSDLESGLIRDKRSASDTPFIRAGKYLHELYRKGVEDALAYSIDGVIYVIHSNLGDDDIAFCFTESSSFAKLRRDEVLRRARPEQDDVTANCLDAFSGRYFL